MFYNIGQRTPSALTKYRIDDLISIDEGWAIHRNKDSFIIYKGWADEGLQRKVEQQYFSAELGVYVIIHRTRTFMYCVCTRSSRTWHEYEYE